MKALIDTSVVLDVLLMRQPHATDAVRLLDRVERGQVQAVLAATSLTTIDYLVTRAVDRRTARSAVDDLLDLMETAPVDGSVLRAALNLDATDFEDAVLHEAGRRTGATVVVTRDLSGSHQLELPALSPTQFLAALEAQDAQR